MNKIVEVIFPNEAIREYGLTVNPTPQTKSYSIDFRDGLAPEEATESMKAFAESLLASPGIKEIGFRKAEIRIETTAAYQDEAGWGCLSPMIVTAIKLHFYPANTATHEVRDERRKYRQSEREDWW